MAKSPGSTVQRLIRHIRYSLIGTVLAIWEFVQALIVPRVQLNFETMEKRTGQTVVMTGGSRGIGLAIVKKLLQLDYTVIIGDPNPSLCEDTLVRMRHEMFVYSGRFKIVYLDLKSLSSVQQFANEVLASEEGKRIHVLINNAGITHSHYDVTIDGYEAHFQVNYLGHFLLTQRLYGRIKETEAECRKDFPCFITYTSSFFHVGGTVDFDDLEDCKVYNQLKSYMDSKLCLVIYGKSLTKLIQEEGLNIHVYTANPGAIPTAMWTDAGGCLRLIRGILLYFCHTVDDAADSQLFPMLNNTDWRGLGGAYFSRGRPAKHSSLVGNRQIEKQLWKRSITLLKGNLSQTAIG